MDYIETDNILENIDGLIGLQEWLGYITPVNLKDESKKVFEDETYNPVFYYPGLEEDVENQIKNYLARFESDGSTLGEIFEKKYIEITFLLNSVKSIGHPVRYTKTSINLFGKPDEELVKEAYKGIGMEVEEEKENVSQENARRELQEHMDNYEVDFRVVIDPNIYIPKPDYHKRLLIIPDRPRSRQSIDRLKFHEIGFVDEKGGALPGHIMRYHLGSQQPYKIFKFGTGFYLKTEENLGVLVEKKAGVFSKKHEKEFRGRVIAAHLALENSFSDVYNEMCKYDFSKEDAFRLALRAKRGLKHTKDKGGTTKDYFYFDTKEVEELSPADRELLSVGKVGIRDIPDIKILLDEGELVLPKI